MAVRDKPRHCPGGSYSLWLGHGYDIAAYAALCAAVALATAIVCGPDTYTAAWWAGSGLLLLVVALPKTPTSVVAVACTAVLCALQLADEYVYSGVALAVFATNTPVVLQLAFCLIVGSTTTVMDATIVLTVIVSLTALAIIVAVLYVRPTRKLRPELVPELQLAYADEVRTLVM